MCKRAFLLLFFLNVLEVFQQQPGDAADRSWPRENFCSHHGEISGAVQHQLAGRQEGRGSADKEMNGEEERTGRKRRTAVVRTRRATALPVCGWSSSQT